MLPGRHSATFSPFSRLQKSPTQKTSQQTLKGRGEGRWAGDPRHSDTQLASCQVSAWFPWPKVPTPATQRQRSADSKATTNAYMLQCEPSRGLVPEHSSSHIMTAPLEPSTTRKTAGPIPLWGSQASIGGPDLHPGRKPQGTLRLYWLL